MKLSGQTPRLAACENETQGEDGTYTACPGRLTFRLGDCDALCDVCGARCGVLVAKYLDGRGPSLAAELAFAAKVADLWHKDHTAGHPNGTGNCPHPTCRQQEGP